MPSPRMEAATKARRQEAFLFGRSLRNELLSKYCAEYGDNEPPPPAKIIDELLTDFMGVTLRFDRLPTNLFAQTCLLDGRMVVTVNSRTSEIDGVKDAYGVQNVAKWHEAIHVCRDADFLRQQTSQEALPGMGKPPTISCASGTDRSRAVGREFFAEMAGRAAAVSRPALMNSAAYLEFLDAKPAPLSGEIRGAWRLLYRAAEDIHVNISALIRQLEFEKVILVDGPPRKATIVRRQQMIK